ncbi:hypothetical protein OG792_34275 [Micromonospora sp. NBC_01699]|nr:hypothetical protein [Micromonospora sp. NBC_01699]
MPLLTAHAAGVHLGIPASTIKQWIRYDGPEQPAMHSVAPETPHGPRLPFIALAEAQILRELRNTGLSMGQIRAGVARLRSDTGEEYVLATNTIASDGGELLYNAATSVAPEWVRARDGQMTFRQVVEAATSCGSRAPTTTVATAGCPNANWIAAASGGTPYRVQISRTARTRSSRASGTSA